MHRRDFLRGSLAAATLPLALRTAFAGEREVHEDLVALTTAWQAARANGRKLLVFPAPTDADARGSVQDFLGEVLTYGGERVWVLLGQVDVVAVRAAALSALAPQCGDATAWAWFIDPSVVPARVAGVRVRPASRDEDVREQYEACPRPSGEEEREAWRAAWMEAAKCRWAAEIARADARITPLVDAFEAAGAALLTPLRDLNARSRARFVALGQQHLRGNLPGAAWSTESGCGSSRDIADPERLGVMFACGMGYIPAHGERVLSFLVPWNESREPAR